jgi:cytochrome c peroxidase
MRLAPWLGAATALVCSAVAHATDPRPLLVGLDLYRPVPIDNPLTPGKIALGRQLFHDRRLSRDGSRSCASCHDPTRGFAGTSAVPRGVGGARGTRNAPALLNRAWGTSFFWDGRVTTLEEQALEPILNPSELGLSREGLLALAQSDGYRHPFRAAFGSDPTIDHVARAIASYVRTIVAGDSPYDRYIAGDARALRDDARRGLGLFGGKAACGTCHSGPLLTDERFHNTGVTSGRGGDPGRARVTGQPADLRAFKTPTLREIARTAPYMHDGSIATLSEVIDFYDGGGHPDPGLDPGIRPLDLNAREKRDLLAFLTALSGRVVDGR